MDFYTTINDYYDQLFPLKMKAVLLFDSLIRGNGPIIDLATGTGTEAIALATKGHKIIGLDLNEDMINTACEKSGSVTEYTTFSVKDMREIRDLRITNASLIYCIGNSIVHLNTLSEISQLLKDCYHTLDDGGSLVIQTVNFDRVLSNRINRLPDLTSSDEKIIFERHYIHYQSNITFKGVLHTGFETTETKTKLLPVTSDQWENLIDISPFENYSIYGDFNGEIFHVNSPAFVTVLQK